MKLKRNGINYKILKQDQNKALCELSNDLQIVGYEVVRIYKKYFPLREKTYTCMTKDSQFGQDGSKTFYRLESAEQYYTNFLKP